MIAKTATVIGATGLVGGELLDLLLSDGYFSTVRILIRRPFTMEHPRLDKKWVNFDDADSMVVAIEGSDAVFVAVGTTQKKVRGDKAAYRKVDYDIPVKVAKYCRITGCKMLVLVSSVGANSSSNNFYLQLKGETEDAVRQSGVEAVHIMRPSILLGKRKESRPIEGLSQTLLKAASFLLPSKYKPIRATNVAKAMLMVSKKQNAGIHIYQFTEMMRLASCTE